MRNQNLVDIVRQFSGKKILVIGDAMLDVYESVTATRRAPEAPILVCLSNNESRKILGGAANVARNVTALGGDATLLAVTGKDKLANDLYALAESDSIKMPRLEDPSRPTTVKQRFIDTSGQPMFRVDYEKTHTLEQSVEDKVRAELQKIDEVDAIIVSDYGKGVVSSYLLSSIRKKFPDTPVVADPHKDQLRSIYAKVDLITPNLSEAHELLNLRSNGVPTEEVVGKRLQADLEVNVLITLSKEGMLLVDKDRKVSMLRVPRVVQVFDVTGAGDTVVSVMGLARATGATYKQGAEIANYAGPMVVEMHGTAIVKQQELIENIRNYSKHI